jgi:hypothetical protein
MITRSPSNQRSYDLVWTGDAAFVQPPELPDNATPEQRTEHEKAIKAYLDKWDVARETNDYAALRVEGSDPTTFTVKPLTHDQMAIIFDMSRDPKTGVAEVNALAFAAALQSVTNLGDVEVKRNVFHAKLGLIASMDFFDKAGLVAGMSVQITLQLGELVIKKAASLSKK